MNRFAAFSIIILVAVLPLVLSLAASEETRRPQNLDFSSAHVARDLSKFDAQNLLDALQMIQEGREIFRFDTFGDEAFWGEALGLHLALSGSGLGGVGSGVSPKTALTVGLKVDVETLPRSLRSALRRRQVDLDDPATTLALLKRDAVVGVKGFFDETGTRLVSVGITCALCHSTVDDSLSQGIGRRLDGWANRDLNVGAIIALAPNLQPFVDLLGFVDPTIDEEIVRTVLGSWGPGKFDASLLMDGKAFRSHGQSAATLIPPAFGLAGINLHTWTGWGSVTHWNAFVANLEMRGQGTFFDPRLNDPIQFPIAAMAGFGDVRNDPDLITPKLAALHLYQLSIPAPRPPNDSFDPQAAKRGKQLFNGRAGCARCMCRRCLPSPAGICIPPKKSASMRFRPIDPRTAAIAPRR